MNKNICSGSKTGVEILLVGFITAIIVFVFSYSFPQNKWDMLGHLGGALHFAIEDPVELHRLTYELARAALSVEAYQELLYGNYEREVWSQDPNAFFQLLPFYEPRVLVTFPAFLAFELGLDPVHYMRFQSSFAAAVGVLVFVLIMGRYGSPGMVLLVPVLALIGGVLEVARFEGADALSFLGYALVVSMMLSRSIWVVVVLALLPLTRSDMIIYCIPALIYCFYIFRGRPVAVALALIACAVVYMGVNHVFGNYGWVKQFYVAQIEYLTHPADAHVSLSVGQYIGAVLRGGIKLVYNYQFQFFTLMAAVTFGACYLRFVEGGFQAILDDDALILTNLAVLFVIAHFFVFPSMHTRYFASQYLHVAIFAALFVQKWATKSMVTRPL